MLRLTVGGDKLPDVCKAKVIPKTTDKDLTDRHFLAMDHCKLNKSETVGG